MSSVQRIVLPALAGAAAMFLGAAEASAQAYPSRPIHIFLSEPGSVADATSRLIQPSVEESLGQPLVMENNPPQMLGAKLLAARPDGYSIALGSGSLWLEKTTYDPTVVFTPITMIAANPFVMIAHPSAPFSDVAGLLAYTKANPGKLNMAVSVTVGSSSTFAADLLRQMTGAQFVSVPYRGAAQQLLAVLANESQVTLTSPQAAMPPANEGRVKALGVTSLEPSLLTPGVKPIAATSGLAGYEVGLSVGFLAPTGTPLEAIRRLNEAVVKALRVPATREKLLTLGIEPIGNTPEQFGAQIKAEIKRWDSVMPAPAKP